MQPSRQPISLEHSADLGESGDGFVGGLREVCGVVGRVLYGRLVGRVLYGKLCVMESYSLVRSG
jgi:hypothetical protein